MRFAKSMLECLSLIPISNYHLLQWGQSVWRVYHSWQMDKRTDSASNSTATGDGNAIPKWPIETSTLAPNLQKTQVGRPINDRNAEECSEEVQQSYVDIQTDQFVAAQHQPIEMGIFRRFPWHSVTARWCAAGWQRADKCALHSGEQGGRRFSVV